ncbi:MAG: HigA family addiction module antidote protein [Chloroflexaceae bacterium]|nr:HigA family addiction module antidote protein [Chloroflexaceae bacterium]NJO05649.1 HigA family addiction module antidote protein [Chloroflexaceae bacterium]
MDNQQAAVYLPDVVSPPGETLLETLETIGMTQAELAERTGRPRKTINEIVQGKTAITPETALQLERVLGIPASFWNRREQHYREALARREEAARLQAHAAWLREFPLRPMIKAGWLDESEEQVQQLRLLLQFFGVASPEQWRAYWQQSSITVAFRKSPAFQVAPYAMAAWLRRGEVLAQQVECAPYHARTFQRILVQARALTVAPPGVFLPQLIALCAEAGVAVVVVPELPRTRVSGATRWLTPTKALMQLSLRYRSDDQFWFTFFHEAGHILLHGKRDAFLDQQEEDELAADDSREREANSFAADLLIPPERWRQLLQSPDYASREHIQAFAAELGIAPGILVGRLQHTRVLPWNSPLNDLKCRLEWAETGIGE